MLKRYEQSCAEVVIQHVENSKEMEIVIKSKDGQLLLVQVQSEKGVTTNVTGIWEKVI